MPMISRTKRLVNVGTAVFKCRTATCVTAVQCRWTSTSSSVESDTATLRDGRKIGFARYGSSDGPKVFYLHGLPGSRLEGRIFEPPASKLGVNIIAPDRPGIGLSSPQVNRTFSDHAKDVGELADILGFKEYQIIGVSAGGPYALACSLNHPPQRLRGVAVVAGLGPHQFGLKGMTLRNRLTFRSLQYAPRLLRLITKPFVKMQLKMTDEEMVQYSLKKLRKNKLPEKDQQVFTDPDVIRLFVASAREHFRQGMDSWMDEGQILGMDWDFRIEDIKFSLIKLWFGMKDTNIASCTGPELKRILGDKAELHMEDEDHVGLEFNCREKILADLVKDM